MAARGASPDCRDRSDQSLKVADPRAVTLTAWPKVPVLHIEYSANYGARIQESRAWLYPRRPKKCRKMAPGADYANSIKSVAYAKVGQSIFPYDHCAFWRECPTVSLLPSSPLSPVLS